MDLHDYVHHGADPIALGLQYVCHNPDCKVRRWKGKNGRAFATATVSISFFVSSMPIFLLPLLMTSISLLFLAPYSLQLSSVISTQNVVSQTSISNQLRCFQSLRFTLSSQSTLSLSSFSSQIPDAKLIAKLKSQLKRLLKPKEVVVERELHLQSLDLLVPLKRVNRLKDL